MPEQTKEKQLILSIETSGTTCGVALSQDNQLLAEYSIFGNNLHDKLLAELCRRIMMDCSKSFDDLGAVAVSMGPGSFTGLRIGVSVAKGLCFRGDIHCIPVPTLEAFAYAATEFAASLGVDEIISAVPSNQNNIFMQRFDSEGNSISEIEILEPSQVLKNLSDKVILCGSGAGEFETDAHQLSGLNRLTPRFIARLAAKLYEKEKWINPDNLVPLYAQEFLVRKTPPKDKATTEPSAL
ncbi:MAG: tRNA (adenosine(37)-N6)-threonylcarbamoyltransferase complex dimerization subunit type 1 TsaB [Ignavibacteriae bacterium]|nr:tRNA (adenosine(37)-N6)-threonylcarbamoyltransferase complex dimerization subunit type 1 TsaB [Ignavibacteriota bacterium]